MRERDKELQKYNYSIKKWYKGKRKTLTIISPPCNTPLIFKDIIEEVLINKGKVLYAWNGAEANKELLKNVKTKEEHSYYLKGENNSSLVFMNIGNYKIIKNKYNLCIIDDISICEMKNKNEVLEAFEHLFLHCDKIIIYSMEKLNFGGETLEVIALNRKKPFVEPRYITTRLNLENEIPYTVYEYLEWFKKNRKKVIILLSNEKNVNKIYDNYAELIESKGIKFNKYFSRNDDEIKKKFNKGKETDVFLLTSIVENYEAIDNINFIVMVSENDHLNCKRIISLCAKAGYYNDKPLGEVIICSKEITKDMDKAKEICRSYNKSLWEQGLLKY